MLDIPESKIDLLPDSRLQDRSKGIIRGTRPGFGTINWTPIFCAHCGKPNGFVPEENMDFVCWLCNRCSEEHGAELAGATYMMPDEVFWMKAQREQLEKYGRLLTEHELLAVTESATTPLAKLLRDKQ